MRLVSVILFALTRPAYGGERAIWNPQVNTATGRTEIDVAYEYQLEVNSVQTTGSTSDVLQRIDNEILATLQETLPNGYVTDPNDLPNVKFESVSSEIFSACFTTSEQCSLIRSNILVSYEGAKPDHSVEKVTLNLVQEYLAAFQDATSATMITYEYPRAVESLAQFRMGPVITRMGTIERNVLESTFLEVFGAIVAAIEGDTLVQDVQFLYQDLFPFQESETEANDYTLATDVRVTGYCRDCSSQEFGDMVDRVITQNLAAYKNKLMSNGDGASSDFFSHITELSYKVPELPSKLPPIEDQSIFDGKPPEVRRAVPWFLFLGIALGVCVILFGSFAIYSDKIEFLDKEDFSTSDSEGYGEEEEDEETGNGEEEATEYAEESQFADGTYDGIDDYQVETIAPTTTEEGTNAETKSDYEVYVF